MQRPVPPRRVAQHASLWLFAAVSAAASLLLPSTAAAGTLAARERAVVRVINQVRAQHHLRPLRLSSLLAGAARGHSSLEAHDNVLAHQLSGEKALPSRVAHAASHGAVGEAVFWSPGDSVHAQRIVATFMASPPHRALLLSKRFRRVGVGVARGHGGLFATVDLAHASGD
jgi:uncharacterized protein YkwD